ncbi:MAG TPA: secondary thiamine-phosphate synthase enzyme YjbQ [Acidobacteriota bacterium]|nr:secondary thiamine-phosphate synthase enzyme YjbQ [Acidobacteriota bacterium]
MQPLKSFQLNPSEIFTTYHEDIRFRSKRCLQFIDVTDRIVKIVGDSGIRHGLANIQTRHTTAAVLINENEPLLLKDLKRTLERIAPRKHSYRHDDFTVRTVNMEPGELANGHAHCKSLYLRASETVNLLDGILQLGRWQRIFFLELDRARDRSLSVQILGTL